MVVAYRMRTFEDTDKIFVLADGKAVEPGTLNKLYQQNGIYSRMVKLRTESSNWTIS